MAHPRCCIALQAVCTSKAPGKFLKEAIAWSLYSVVHHIVGRCKPVAFVNLVVVSTNGLNENTADS